MSNPSISNEFYGSTDADVGPRVDRESAHKRITTRAAMELA